MAEAGPEAGRATAGYRRAARGDPAMGLGGGELSGEACVAHL